MAAAIAARVRAGVAFVSFRVCGSGSVDVSVRATRGARTSASLVSLALGDGDCLAYRLGLTVPKGAGAATVSVGTGGATGTAVKL